MDYCTFYPDGGNWQYKVLGELTGLSRLRELSMSSTPIGNVVPRLREAPLRVLRLPHCYLGRGWNMEALYDQLQVGRCLARGHAT